jgi:hypothetical protein
MERSMGMKFRRKASFLVFFWLLGILTPFTANSQYIKEKMALNGYVKYLNSLFIPSQDSIPIITDNLIHNRLNYSWYISKNFEFHTSMRNRIFWGELVKVNPGLSASLQDDIGYFDLTKVWAEGEAYIFQTVFDRLNFTARFGNSEFIVGRQRINWGTGLVWNPNDIFNAFSFFDFDYEERPGTDAFLYRNYLSPVSKLELVYAIGDSLEGSTISGLLKINKRGYDLQGFLGYQRGFYNVGFGWEGAIRGAGFRGEASIWEPAANTTGPAQLVASTDLDYTFPSSLYIHGAYLYNSEGINTSTGDYQGFYLSRELGARTLSPSMHTFFAELSGQLSPIIRGSLFGMVNPGDGSFFFGPMLNWNVSNDFEVLFNGQIFVGEPNTAFGGYGSILYLRVKYSF